jgi:hypothetical protein
VSSPDDQSDAARPSGRLFRDEALARYAAERRQAQHLHQTSGRTLALLWTAVAMLAGGLLAFCLQLGSVR